MKLESTMTTKFKQGMNHADISDKLLLCLQLIK